MSIVQQIANGVATTLATANAVRGSAVTVISGLSNPADDDPSSLAEEDFDNLPLRSLMSMLVHKTYFRDLNMLQEFVAGLMDYSNPRAMKYAEEHWEPYHSESELQEMMPELQELGLAFLRRKRTHTNRNAPDLAIVLRGTIPFNLMDLSADLKIGLNKLNEDERVLRSVSLIVQVVKKFRRWRWITWAKKKCRGENPGERICMAGHSLGAAIALIVGGVLYSTHNINIDTHLFNPPLLTVVDVLAGRVLPNPRATSSSHEVDDDLHLRVDFAKLKRVFVYHLVDDKAVADERAQFQKLKNWVPHFYLNPGDPICNQYETFYKNAETLDHVISGQGILSRLFSSDAKLFKNVVPSAELHISNWKSDDFRLAHSLRQWHKYKPEFINLQHHSACLLSGDGYHNSKLRRFANKFRSTS